MVHTCVCVHNTYMRLYGWYVHVHVHGTYMCLYGWYVHVHVHGTCMCMVRTCVCIDGTYMCLYGWYVHVHVTYMCLYRWYVHVFVWMVRTCACAWYEHVLYRWYVHVCVNALTFHTECAVRSNISLCVMDCSSDVGVHCRCDSNSQINIQTPPTKIPPPIIWSPVYFTLPLNMLPPVYLPEVLCL